MAKDVQFNIKLNIDGKEQIVTASTNTRGLAESLGIAKTESDRLRDSLVTLTQANMVVQRLSDSLKGMTSWMSQLINVNTANVEAETKLATNMRNTMAATDAEIQSVMDLCAAQQQLGVISQGTQEAGAQAMAKYLEQKDSLETLIPVMNDMLAQQYGLNASSEQAASVATMLGKVMNGQTSALTRYGYSFTEAQAEILKFGTEQERAATLAEVVTSAVGGMNAELAKTDAGRAKQAAMTLDNLRASAGAALSKLEPMIKVSTGIVQALAGIGQAGIGIRGTAQAVNALAKAIKAASNATKVFMGIGVAAAFAAITTVIVKLISSTKAAAASFETLKSAEEAGMDAQANAKVEIDSQIKKLKDLKDRNADTSQAVKNLNETYGGIMGTWQTADDWITTLTKHQNAYARSIGYEVQMRELSIEQVKKQIELQDKQDAIEKIKSDLAAGNYNVTSTYGSTYGGTSTGVYTDTGAYNTAMRNAQNALKKTQAEYDAIGKKIDWLAEKSKEAAEEMGGVGTPTGGTTSTATAAVGYIDPGEYRTLQDYADKLADLNKQRMQATQEMLPVIDEEIKRITEERDAFQGLRKEEVQEVQEYVPKAVEKLNTLKDLTDALTYYRDLQNGQSIEEAQQTQQVIDLLQNREKAMRGLLNLPAIQDQTAAFEGLSGKALEIELKLFGADEVRNTLLNLRALLANAPDDQKLGLEELIEKWQNYNAVLNVGKGGYSAAQQGLQGIGNVMGSLGGMMDNETEQWMRWGQQVLQSIASAIPAIMSLVTAKNQEATANTAAAASGAASSVASIPFVGWAMAVAAVAAIVAALSSLPKFAAGGIAYGPTLGLFGEYSGASTNPEVVAPLDRLRSILKAPEDSYGKVRFEIEGRTLRGILVKENNLISRS